MGVRPANTHWSLRVLDSSRMNCVRHLLCQSTWDVGCLVSFNLHWVLGENPLPHWPHVQDGDAPALNQTIHVSWLVPTVPEAQMLLPWGSDLSANQVAKTFPPVVALAELLFPTLTTHHLLCAVVSLRACKDWKGGRTAGKERGQLPSVGLRSHVAPRCQLPSLSAF